MRKQGGLDRSQWLILSILGMAVLMAGFGVAYRYSYGRKALDFWGPEHAGRIRNATAVDLLVLRPIPDDGAAPPESASTLTDPAGERWQIEQALPLGEVADFLHIRRLFVQDAYFDWQATEHLPASWQYAVRFHDATGASTLLLAAEGSEVCLLENTQQVSLLTGVMPSVRKFFDRQVQQHPATPSPAGQRP